MREEVADGDVILVGEKHDSSRSRKLGERVVEEVDPSVVAIEKVTAGYRYRAAMGAVSEFARAKGIPLVAIDKRYTGPPGVTQAANHFAREVREDGTVPVRSATEARRSVYDEFGREAFCNMYIDREKAMVAHLKAALSEFGAPMVAAVGAFHVHAIKDLWGIIDSSGALPESRVRAKHETDNTVHQLAGVA